MSGMLGTRSRTCSESSEGGEGMRPQSPVSPGGGNRPQSPVSPGKLEPSTMAYDLDGKFTYSQVLKANLGKKLKTTIDENGKFSYFSADMRPVPPGWYDVDKTKHRVPIGWYDNKKSAK
eukprot:TRINITY_DN5065_c0_g1_i11.p1 TRINITY_DN5065_c0_g1~~TRINITY_DN5065_c0_g1_i11.p1  ORF type:complete len:119 (-),score=27.54 TRINITY_DN5065_c0_g1_i11:220-576(-)